MPTLGMRSDRPRSGSHAGLLRAHLTAQRGRVMRSLGHHSLLSRSGPSIGLALCAAVVLAWAWGQLVPNPDGPQALAPDWLPLAAAAVAAPGAG